MIRVNLKNKILICMLLAAVLLLNVMMAAFLYNDNQAHAQQPKQSTLSVSIDPAGSSFQLGVGTDTTFTASANGTDPVFTWTLTPSGNFNFSINGETVSFESAINVQVSGVYLSLMFLNVAENQSVQVFASAVDANGLEGRSEVVLIADPHIHIAEPYTNQNSKFEVSADTASYIVQADGNGVYRAINGTTGEVEYSSTNASYLINSAIDNGNVSIHLQNGKYLCSTPIIGKNNAVLTGESMGPYDDFNVGTILIYTGASSDPFLDFRNCPYVSLSDFKILNTGSSSVGIRVGSEANLAATRTKCSSLHSITIMDFPTGILGDTYGMDDSSLYDLYVGNARTVAIDHLSSQVKMFGGSIFGDCAIGVRITGANGHPDTGMEFYGTVWSGPKICVDFTGASRIRGAAFYGTWMENCDGALLRTSTMTVGTYVSGISFYNCYGYTNTDATALFDLSGTNVKLSWSGGELWPLDDGEAVITNGAGSTKQQLDIQPACGAPRISYSDSNDGVDFVNKGSLVLYDAGTFGEYTTLTGASWATYAKDNMVPWNRELLKKATVVLLWDTQSTGAGFRLEYPFGVEVNGSKAEPSANGYQTEVLDITAFARANMDFGNNLVFRMHGDGSTAPIIYRAILNYEW
jgi:hypothetical protein